MAKVSFELNNKVIGVMIFAIVVIVLQLVTLQQVKSSNDATRTIQATGEAVIEAVPDQFQFSPYFEFANDDANALKDAMAAKGTAVVDGLKALGVADSDINLDVSQYDYYYFDEDEDTQRGQVSISVKLTNKDLAQKVQDYLNNEGAEGRISPYPTFSEAKQKELRQQAEQLATEDARENAERIASGLDAKVGKVVKVNPEPQAATPIYTLQSDVGVTESSASPRSLPIQPGSNEYRYSITVVFELR